MVDRLEKLAFVFAMEREARPFRRLCPEARVCVTGIGERNAKRSMHRLLESARPSAVIAAGFAGALDPALNVGDVVVAAAVSEGEAKLTTTLTFPTQRGDLLTVGQLVATPDEKAALRQMYGAVAVDMESAAIASVCQQHDIPWAIVRVISDRADSNLSPQLVSLLNQGSVSISLTVMKVLRQPSLMMEFFRLARDTRLAANRLAHWLADNVR